jgi:epoxide hydrolase-like predicted phosphatase
MKDNQKPIRAVLWDIGGVIVRTLDWSGRSKWEEKLGLQPHELERLVFRGEMGVKASLGAATVDDVWRWVIQQLGIPDNSRDQLQKDFFAGDDVDDELVDYIRKLKSKFKTGIISNAWPDTRYWLEEQWRIADAFDHIIISAEVGIAKPDPRIYRLALDALQVTPAEAVFIDDFEENIAGACSLGMQGIRFQDRVQTILELETLLAHTNGSMDVVSS